MPASDVYPAALPNVTAVGGTSLIATDDPRAPGGSSSPRGRSTTGWAPARGATWRSPSLAYQPVTGCAGRAYADVSADADPATGLLIYDSEQGGWLSGGGTSLATPLVAAFEAVTGVDGLGPQWAYRDGPLLNDPVTGSSGTCAPAILDICDAGPGYDGPTGTGSISGDVITGAPGIGGPAVGDGSG